MLDCFFRQRIDVGGPDLRDVNTQLEASIDHVEHTEDIGPQSLDLVVPPPVDVRSTARAGTVDNRCPPGLDTLSRRLSWSRLAASSSSQWQR